MSKLLPGVGLLVHLGPGLTGRVHLADLSGAWPNEDPLKPFKLGQHLQTRVLAVRPAATAEAQPEAQPEAEASSSDSDDYEPAAKRAAKPAQGAGAAAAAAATAPPAAASSVSGGCCCGLPADACHAVCCAQAAAQEAKTADKLLVDLSLVLSPDPSARAVVAAADEQHAAPYGGVASAGELQLQQLVRGFVKVRPPRLAPCAVARCPLQVGRRRGHGAGVQQEGLLRVAGPPARGQSAPQGAVRQVHS